MIDQTKPHRYKRQDETIIAYKTSSPILISGEAVEVGHWVIIDESNGKVLEICSEEDFTYEPV